MSDFKIATRYAKSLIELSKERNVLEQVYQDMLLFLNTCDDNRQLRLLLQNPVVHNYKKLQILKAIFGSHVNVLTSKFFELLVKKTREGILYEIALEFHAQYNLLNGIEVAEVTTPVALSDELRAEFLQMAQKISGAKKVELKEKINTALIGGFILKINDKQIDSSLYSKLRTLKLQFADNTILK
jgi:F-type H+-transporting ATPase subunit delta